MACGGGQRHRPRTWTGPALGRAWLRTGSQQRVVDRAALDLPLSTGLERRQYVRSESAWSAIPPWRHSASSAGAVALTLGGVALTLQGMPLAHHPAPYPQPGFEGLDVD